MKPWSRALLVLLLAVGATQAGDGADEKPKQQPKFARGVMRSLSVKDGVGTLTILAAQDKAAPIEIKLAITGSTKFYWFGKLGRDGRPARQGSPVDVTDVAAGLRKYGVIWAYYTEEGEKKTGTLVDGHP